MAEKYLKPDEPVVEEEAVLAPTEEMLDAMRAEIADLEEKESILTEKLCLAKEKGLVAQAEKCRELLQIVILQKMRKTDELREAEAHKVAAELDALTAELEQEINPSPITEEQIEEQYNYMAKSKRLTLVSKIIGGIGTFACVVGALVYLILTQVETMNLPFEWLYLIADGAAFLLFGLIALCIRKSAKRCKQIAEEIEAEILETERLIAEQKAAEAMMLERLDANAEAYTAETNQAIENAKPPRKKFGPITLPEIPDAVKNNVHKIAPVAAVCVTTVAAAAVVSSQKRAAEAKRASATRKEFFKWLG